MRQALLKAQAKKKKYLKRIEKIRKEEDSDGSLSSDDEEEISESMIGNGVNNQYMILKYLGRGTFSKTWLIYDYLNDKFMALKLYEKRYFKELDLEIETFKRLSKNGNQENIIEFYGDIEFKNGDNFYRGLLLELLGDSLDVLIAEEYDSNINSNTIKKIFSDILNGIDYIHRCGLVHNDLKLDNILFSKLNHKVEKFINKVKDLKINEYFLNAVEKLSPPQLQLLDKKKRKMVKRKIKEGAHKETIKNFRSQIIEINNSTLENLTLEIEENEKEDDIKPATIDLENIKVKIIDMGSAELIGKLESDEILSRSYRPPENILNSYYDNKADVWVIGCLLYELFNGMPLFDLKDSKLTGKDKDRLHIAQMYDVLGKMPKDMALQCEFSEDIFDSKGRVIKNKGIEERDLKKELCQRFQVDESELESIHSLILKILDYDLKTRPSCKEILEHEWFQKCD